MKKEELREKEEQKNKTLKQLEQMSEKNDELNEKIEKIKKKITKKSKELEKELKENVSDFSEDVKETAKIINDELKEKSKDFKKEFKETTEEIKDKAEEILKNVKISSKKFDKKDIIENKAMACLAYIMAPVPYFVETKSKWVRYHAIQGMNLFIIEVILCLIVTVINSLIFWPFLFLKTIIKLSLYAFMVIYAIIGIINVCNEEAKELPLINKFKFIKK